MFEICCWQCGSPVHHEGNKVPLDPEAYSLENLLKQDLSRHKLERSRQESVHLRYERSFAAQSGAW